MGTDRTRSLTHLLLQYTHTYTLHEISVTTISNHFVFLPCTFTLRGVVNVCMYVHMYVSIYVCTCGRTVSTSELSNYSLVMF